MKKFNCEKCGLLFTKNGYYSHINRCKLNINDIKEIKIKYINNGYSIRDISSEYNINKTLVSKILSEEIRNLSESIKVAHLYKKDRYLHTDETKSKIRKKRLEYIKNNPDKTAWRLSNISYPEKLFNDKLITDKYNEKYLIIREYSFYPYFIDFAFINEKIAIEIDGSQHLLDDRKNKDYKKDELLLKNEWKVIRITEKEIKNNINDTFIVIDDILKNNVCDKYIKVGILEYKKEKYKKLKRNINGKTDKQIIRDFNQRKIKDRPMVEQLFEDIKDLGYCGTGKKYGVSDNTIRNWIKNT